ncbi:MAG: SDR family oxidoreductase [Hyphomonadaceae bacterium]|nr:SDR family oxidoreductase [Hyphomonadaceae bacterium]
MNWALVTGAGQRLGRAVALHLARHSWNIAVHYRSSVSEAEAVADEARVFGVSALAIAADLAEQSERHALISRAVAAAGAPITALVNCAALFEHDTIDTFTEDAFARHMAVNALTPALLAREFAEALPEDARGAIVNFLDFKLANPYPDHFSYTLSKYALAGATDLLARALAPRVRVNAVAPGYVLPAPGQSDTDFRRLHDDTPLQSGPTPEQIAYAVRFLVENDAITGQTIYVDSGRRFSSHDRDMAFM